MRDPYSVLGLTSTAKPQEIKSAFRKLAKKYHPDHNQNDKTAQQKFSEINQAYEIIGDQAKKAQFDRGEIDADGKPVYQGFGGQGHQGAGGGNPFSGGEHFDFRSGGAGFDVNDVFRDLFGRSAQSQTSGFGGQRRSHAAHKGADLKANLTVSLEQIVGADKVEATFPNGKTLKIKLPAYVEDGQAIRLKGQGEKALGGSAGDAIVTLYIKKQSRFRIDGRALHLDLPVALKNAVIGGKTVVDTLDGRISLTVPAWSSSDKVLRLKGRGLPMKNGGRDDLFVHIRVMLPEDKDPQLEELMKKTQ